jgi:hypothetical protein
LAAGSPCGARWKSSSTTSGRSAARRCSPIAWWRCRSGSPTLRPHEPSFVLRSEWSRHSLTRRYVSRNQPHAAFPSGERPGLRLRRRIPAAKSRPRPPPISTVLRRAGGRRQARAASGEGSISKKTNGQGMSCFSVDCRPRLQGRHPCPDGAFVFGRGLDRDLRRCPGHIGGAGANSCPRSCDDEVRAGQWPAAHTVPRQSCVRPALRLFGTAVQRVKSVDDVAARASRVIARVHGCSGNVLYSRTAAH